MDQSTEIPEDDAGREAFWRGHVESWQASGLTQRQYVRQHGLPLARFTYWKGKLFPRESRLDGFVRLQVAPNPVVVIRHPSGSIVECASGIDPAWLRALLGMDNAS
jgi:hypothetical protein